MKKPLSIKKRTSVTLEPEAIEFLNSEKHKQDRSVSYIANKLILEAKKKAK